MEFIVNVPENKADFFLELVKNLKFKVEQKATIKEPLTTEQQEWVDDLKESLRQVELHQQGKIKLKSARQLLDEL
jgi:hypothetical protein